MTTNNINKGIMGTVRILANRWALTDSLALASSLVARRTTKVMVRMPKSNLLTRLYEVYTQTRRSVNVDSFVTD